MKRSLAEIKTRAGMKALRGVVTSLLPTLDLLAGSWVSASLSYFLKILVGRLIQELYQTQDLEAIVKEKEIRQGYNSFKQTN